MNDFRNWKKVKLVTEIENLGGVVHPSWNLNTLRQSYELTAAKRREGPVHVSERTVTLSQIANQDTSGHATQDIDPAEIEVTSDNTETPSANTHAPNVVPSNSNTNTNKKDGGTHDKETENALAKMVHVVHSLLDNRPKDSNESTHNLNSAMKSTFGILPFLNENTAQHVTGISSNYITPQIPTTPSHPITVKQLPKTDMVSPNLRKQILEGKDVNLASLLIPHYDLTCQTGDNSKSFSSTQKDPKLNQDLSIEDFNLAFEKYKNVICSVFSKRQTDLTQYGQDINMISRHYGPRFYLYHKMFSRKAAAGIEEHNTVALWDAVDDSLLNLVMHGVPTRACEKCNEINHSTRFCPHTISTNFQASTTKSSSTTQPEYVRKPQKTSVVEDRRGRVIVTHRGETICNNFNDAGCFYSKAVCYYKHICKTCFSHDHGMKDCNGNNYQRETKQYRK